MSLSGNVVIVKPNYSKMAFADSIEKSKNWLRVRYIKKQKNIYKLASYINSLSARKVATFYLEILNF